MKLQPSRALLGSLGILLPLALLLPFPIASAQGGATFVVDMTVDGVDIFPGDTRLRHGGRTTARCGRP